MSTGPGNENELSKKSAEMKIPSQYDNVDYGKKTKIVTRKVTYKERGGTGKFYGSRAIATKESKDSPLEQLTFIGHLIAEQSDISTLPDSVVREIKGNISKGSKDLEQQWKNALELVYKAYQVSGVRRPTPNEKGAWKQFEELLRFGVQQLAATRGRDGKWRTTDTYVREAQEQPQHIGKRRFFVEVPGEAAQEVDGANLDEIIEAITNKIRTDRSVTGTKVRIEERTKKHAVLTIWVNDVKRERIIIKEVS